MVFSFEGADALLVDYRDYLLGNYTGLQFDHGFDIDTRPNGRSKNHVHWMSESELAPLLDRFMVEDA